MKCKFIFSVCILFCVLFQGCKDKNTTGFDKYITGYTSGVIHSGTPVRIYLAQEPENFQTGSVLPAHILNIDPAVKGELILKENRCVEFIPQERFRNGTTYRMTFQLGKLCKVPKPFRKFGFEVKIIPLSLIYEPGNFLTDPNEENALQYEGILQSSDDINPQEVEQKMKASYDGQDITPEWTHDGNRHHFKIRPLLKGTDTKILKLQFPEEIRNGEKTDIEVPGINDLTVLDVKANDNTPPVISAYLSEKLDPDQNLQGLVSVDGKTAVNYKISDNIIYLYPTATNEADHLTVTLHEGIKSQSGKRLQITYTTTVRHNPAQPQVRFIGKGVIVPDENRVILPFSAIALKAVDVEIIKVFNQNMNFFLQSNLYDGHYQLTHTARPVFMKKIDLQKEYPDLDLNHWHDFTLELGKMVKLEKGTVYRVRLKFKKSYTTLSCADEGPDSDYSTVNWDNPDTYYYEGEYPSGYEWKKRNDPCHISYYNGDRFEARNIINTSLGLMAKSGAGNHYIVSVNQLATTQPVANCKVVLYNLQNQKLDSAYTDKNGFAQLNPTEKAFVLTAQAGPDKAWLKLRDGDALSLSNFDVSGQHVQMGVKGFIYGERGVWRPGDELYLSLILEDKLKVLPDGHPIVAQLMDPNGHIVQTRTGETGNNNIHCFTFKTAEDAQTGYWHALFKIGGLTFSKTLRIEAIKPNRLAINLEFPNEQIIGTGVSNAPVEVHTRWLNGAPTSHLKADVQVRLSANKSGFASFPDYTFYDRSKNFEATTVSLFEGNTNGEGSFSLNLDKIKPNNAPGTLNASFTTRVFENGGDFSISTQTIRYSPYTEYVGIRLPQNDDNWYTTQKPVLLSGVTVTPTGKQSGGNSVIHLDVYKLDWHWWWDAEDENLSFYVNREYSKSILTKTVKATDGTFSVPLEIPQYGRYFIRARISSGHTAGIIAYFGSWEDNNNQEMATMLRLSTDKKSYQAGEDIRVTFPSSAGATAIVSLENGKTIHDIRRVETQQGTTTLTFRANKEMCPNTYVAVTLLQPYNSQDNDRPIRMYGVVNVNIEDPGLHLHPQVKVSPELHPAKDFTIEVGEENGKAMNYTIAVIDEGLLSLTTFRTPEPFAAFYAREALGVKTWDFYDYIYGAYGARLDKAFAVGGDESLKNLQDEKTNRFKPVVLFSGPYSLKANEKQKHTFRMPEYIGEVRTMVIAATNGCYGSTEASSTVSNPLMVSVALPRLFTPGDVTDIPVTVFAMKDHIREVTVNMQSDSKITLLGNTSQQIRFNKPGEQVVWFKARINQETGESTLRTEAISGNETAKVTEDITIRVPNPRLTQIEEQEAKAGETVSFSTPISGDRPVSVLEISSIPPLNLEQRLGYLLDYPHGCSEQITSKAFPQLSLPWLLSLNAAQQAEAESHVREVILRLGSYQTPEGGFAYWPGSPYISEWVTSYATQFLVSAQQQGYSIPAGMLTHATNYLRKVTNSWNNTEPWSQLEQAYRLYVLALSGRPDLAAMNRLKESQLQRPVSQWLLASCYALCNEKDMARKMVRDLSSDVAVYRETGGTFGSSTRDNALILQSMVTLDLQQPAYRMLEKISRSMGSREWFSTQETAFTLHAAALFVRKYLGSQQGIHVLVTTPEGKQEITTEKTLWQLPLPLRQGKAVASVRNNGEGTLFVRQINRYAPFEAVKEKIMSGLQMEVRYCNDQGTPLDIRHLKQGEDVLTEISVRNTGLTGTYEELALSYLVPSGFEIINERLTANATWPGAEHIDIRDDCFHIYFSLRQNETKIFKFRCNAAFRGDYMLPAVQCSAMYDNTIQAIWPGGRINIE